MSTLLKNLRVCSEVPNLLEYEDLTLAVYFSSIH